MSRGSGRAYSLISVFPALSLWLAPDGPESWLQKNPEQEPLASLTCSAWPLLTPHPGCCNQAQPGRGRAEQNSPRLCLGIRSWLGAAVPASLRRGLERNVEGQRLQESAPAGPSPGQEAAGCRRCFQGHLSGQGPGTRRHLGLEGPVPHTASSRSLKR